MSRALMLPKNIAEQEIKAAIAEFGTDAVLRYRQISGMPDDEVREEFISSFIAGRLYDRFERRVQIEKPYGKIAEELELNLSKESMNSIGDLRADIVIYDKNQDRLKPMAIVEIKKFSGNHPIQKIVGDFRKTQILNMKGYIIDLYVGVLICETSKDLKGRTRELNDATGKRFHLGEEQLSWDSKWQWCFGCARE